MDSYYDFVYVDDVDRTLINRIAKKRNNFTKSYQLLIKLKTITPVHIGSLYKVLKNQKVVLKFIRSNNKPIIPGSSMKGVISTNFLALTGSSVKTSELFGTIKSIKTPKKHIKSIYISKAFFSTFQPNDHELKIYDVDNAYEPHPPNIDKCRFNISSRMLEKCCLKYYPRGKQINESVYQIEALKPKTIIQGSITLTQVSNFELGGIIASFGYLKYKTRYAFKIGYGKWQRCVKSNPKKTYGLVYVVGIGLKELKINKDNFSIEYQPIDKETRDRIVYNFIKTRRDRYDTIRDVFEDYFIPLRDVL